MLMIGKYIFQNVLGRAKFKESCLVKSKTKGSKNNQQPVLNKHSALTLAQNTLVCVIRRMAAVYFVFVLETDDSYYRYKSDSNS